jgi:mono/diheme cytochrome c family protein
MHKTLVCSGVSTAFLLTCVLVAQIPERSTNSGVFTKEQLVRGQNTFQAHCSDCHDPSYFQGRDFLDHWSNRSLFALWDMVSEGMPANDPGSLSQQEYADVTALLLSLNGVPVGIVELQGGKDVMSSIRFDTPPTP